MVPTSALPPTTLFTLYVTERLVAPVTVAVNWRVENGAMVEPFGESDTVIAGGTGVGAGSGVGVGVGVGVGLVPEAATV